jgi:hypothetical protein
VFQVTAKYLEAKELEARQPYPAAALLTLLVGTETLSLVGPHELLDGLDGIEPLSDVSLELRVRRVPLAALGASGKGNVYRLSVVGFLDPEEVA